jgi:lysophospholipase L1-like esterase
MTTRDAHVVLLGDSIFDNHRYVTPGPDVVTQLRAQLSHQSSATLRAVDGAVTAGLSGQLRDIPPDATHLIVSIGGNDALQNADLLTQRVRNSAEALSAFAVRLTRFESSYRDAIGRVLARGVPTTVCTIYNGNLDEAEAPAARMGVALFNDVILRLALEHQVDVLELRHVCSEPADYANPIEPSVRGGLKIARAIAAIVLAQPTNPRHPRLWGAVA